MLCRNVDYKRLVPSKTVKYALRSNRAFFNSLIMLENANNAQGFCHRKLWTRLYQIKLDSSSCKETIRTYLEVLFELLCIGCAQSLKIIIGSHTINADALEFAFLQIRNIALSCS